MTSRSLVDALVRWCTPSKTAIPGAGPVVLPTVRPRATRYLAAGALAAAASLVSLGAAVAPAWVHGAPQDIRAAGRAAGGAPLAKTAPLPSVDPSPGAVVGEAKDPA
jgi:hypothetical protein